jgi:hypothetical protein
VTDASPPIGAGALLEPSGAPAALFHGTNFVSAAAIMLCGTIEAEEPVDGEDLGAVVCTTSDEDMGRSFAIEFVRLNSELPVGAVFRLDGPKVAATQELFPYHAETAGVFEHEYRATGDLTVEGHVLSVTLVGETDLLDEDAFLEDAWHDMPAHQKAWFGDMGRFWKAVETLMIRAGRPRTIEQDHDQDDDQDEPDDDASDQKDD